MTEPVKIPEELRELARALIAQIDREAVFGSEDFGLHYELAEPLVLSALMKAKEAGEMQERARCADVASRLAQFETGNGGDKWCLIIETAIRARQDTGRG